MRSLAVPSVASAALSSASASPAGRIVAVALAVLAASGCGPSLRRMHRSEVYFERCYAADLDVNVPVVERRACWQDWMTHWQADQPPNRIDYVRERVLRLDPESAAIVALSTGATESVDGTPEIAAEATIVTEAMGRAPDDVVEVSQDAGAAPLAEVSSDGGVEVVAEMPADAGAAAGVPEPTVVVRSDADATPAEIIEDPGPAPRTIAPASERRMQRAPVLPGSAQPHCAEACRPGWAQCTAGCTTGDRAACVRACRLELRACSRACY